MRVYLPGGPGGEGLALGLVEPRRRAGNVVLAGAGEPHALAAARLGLEVYHPVGLQLAQGGVHGLLADAGALVYVAELAAPAAVVHRVKHAHRAVRDAELERRLVIERVSLRDEIVDAVQFFQRPVVHGHAS